MGCALAETQPLVVEIVMSSWKQGIVAALVGLALAGCSGGGRVSDGPQSFLGISQDIGSVFSTGDSYRSPLRPSFLAN
ncbi:MAG TPA: hypothetical protein VHT04_03480 [Stellaceae bacterium]|jgi:hypothetical protein|nr:hypothetical protein [Stellaceae bacterium]